MCFYLNADSAPRVADRPILVWKWLMHIDGQAMSPYQKHLYTFGQTKVAFIGAVKKHLVTSGMDIGFGIKATVPVTVIEEGLHGYYMEDTAKDKAQKFSHSGDLHRVHPAIIPAGTKYRIGMKGEFVSEALVVYEDMESLEADHGPARGV